jgi:hypothetical protein
MNVDDVEMNERNARRLLMQGPHGGPRLSDGTVGPAN